ncbi:MAG: phosphatidylinositol-specific phospholipase C/glycerophosphodiester phosphodiesterase family protein [Bacteroidetes bacterium]|nr:phosphatidylinositol-specific phospholipase C/glycerophosphodiester phosphodiesterase family protein [Bacteroidota bacterium]
MKQILTILLFINTICGIAQPVKYTTSNAHSHNDYEQTNPLYEAFDNGFGSIEADIFLQDTFLMVGHELKELNKNRTLQSLYLNPLQSAIKNNHGYPYSDKHKQLQLMIDIKTNAIATLDTLIHLLQQYPEIIYCKAVLITISGNRPSPASFKLYPAYIHFDGVLSTSYTGEALEKIVMLSDDFKKYSLWDGSGSLPQQDRQTLVDLINKAHRFKKKIRFWDAPDNANAWKTFMDLKVDFINTDHIQQLSSFIISK